MSDQLSIFDMLGKDNKFKEIESKEWKWTYEDYPEKNGFTVFSCFACGGGSTMGYKLAGFDVIGCLEIDKEMNAIYNLNHTPKFNFNMDIRKFNLLPNKDIPKELFSLDILDGSPPCTTFSLSGLREKTWGQTKKFKEGQAEQTLDDLPFVFIETVNKLKPKFVVMENVEGIVLGNAWSYVQRIYKSFHDIGYNVNHWVLKGENMGIPQKRHRVFFIATRLSIDLKRMDMSFNYKPILFSQVKSKNGSDKPLFKSLIELLKFAKYGDRTLEKACLRQRNKGSFFNYSFVYDNQVAPTLTAHCNNIRWDLKTFLSKEDILSISTFPQDFIFLNENIDQVTYVCGMSVPPIMIKRIAERILFYLKE